MPIKCTYNDLRKTTQFTSAGMITLVLILQGFLLWKKDEISKQKFPFLIMLLLGISVAVIQGVVFKNSGSTVNTQNAECANPNEEQIRRMTTAEFSLAIASVVAQFVFLFTSGKIGKTGIVAVVSGFSNIIITIAILTMSMYTAIKS